MNLDVKEWYEKEFKQYVSAETCVYVTAFSIIWTQYENILYGCHFEWRENKRKEIIRLEENFSRSNSLKQKFSDILLNLKTYCTVKHVTTVAIYKQFLFDNDPNRKPICTYEEFDEIFNSDSLKDEICLMLYLLGRVRNNLFHGEKAIYDLNNQIDLFKNLEEFMILSIETLRYKGQ